MAKVELRQHNQSVSLLNTGDLVTFAAGEAQPIGMLWLPDSWVVTHLNP